MADSYFALTIAATGTSTSAYYSVTPTSDLTFSQGGVTIVPTSADPTLVNVYPETLQIQSPPGSINGGVTIATSATEIAGRVMVSPPVNVAVVVTLYGSGGQQLGQAIVDPGTSSKAFNFPVPTDKGIAGPDVAGVLRGLIPPATP